MTDDDQDRTHLTKVAARALAGLPDACAGLGLSVVPKARLTRDTGSRQRHADSVRIPINVTAVDLANTHHKISSPVVRDHDNYRLDLIAGRRLGIIPTLSNWCRTVDAALWDAGIEHDEHGVRACTSTCQEAPVRARRVLELGPCPADSDDGYGRPGGGRWHATTPTVGSECSFLLTHLDWAAGQPTPEWYAPTHWYEPETDASDQVDWIVDLVADLDRMLKDARSVTGAAVPEPLRCTFCGWTVDPQDGGAWYRCSGCERSWSRVELHNMAERTKPKTLTELVGPTGLSMVTLRRYEADGRIAPNGRRGQAKTYDLDEVMRATHTERYRPTRGQKGRFAKRSRDSPSPTV